MKRFTIVSHAQGKAVTRQSILANNLIDAFILFFGENGEDTIHATDMLLAAERDGMVDINKQLDILTLTLTNATYIIVGDK